VILALGVFIFCLYYLRYAHSIPHLSRVFILRDVEYYCIHFSASVEMATWFLSFILFICCIIFMDFCMPNQPCIHGMIHLNHSV
jgi:hypothetical protein